MLSHKSPTITEIAIFNLPCMHSIFKDVQEQFEISFFSLYRNLVSTNGAGTLKLKAIQSFHEVFIMIKDEDTTNYKQVYLNLLTDDCKVVTSILNKNLAGVMFNWINEFTAKQLMDTPMSNMNSGSNGTGTSTVEKGVDNDFSGVANKKTVLNKKRHTSHAIIDFIKEEASDESRSIQRPNVFITDENSPELIYSDLLDNLMMLVINIQNQEGNWREHMKLL